MLSDIGSIASIIGLPLSIWALVAVMRLKKRLRDRAIDSRVRGRFYGLRNIPGNRRLTTASRRDITALIKDIDDFYLPLSKSNNQEARTVLVRIRAALQDEPEVKALKEDFELLENIILNHERF